MNIYTASAVTAVLALVICRVLGHIFIPYFRKKHIGQNILSETGHQKKQGVPTMGGIMIIIAVAVSLCVIYPAAKAFGADIIAAGSDRPADSIKTRLFACLILASGMGLIGLADDMMKIRRKQNEGLTIMQKTACQVIVIFGFLLSLDRAGAHFTLVPYLNGNLIESRLFFWITGFIAVYCTVNATNFTDGLDGLCSSVSSVMCVFFGICAVLLNLKGAAVPAAATVGALAGFLTWNRNPAKIIMGDCGSLFIGGILAGLAYMLNAPWLILLICFIHVIEFASVVIQNAYALTHRGARLFRMSPLHHHYQLGGWSENRVCAVFSAISVLTGTAAAALVYFGITAYMK